MKAPIRLTAILCGVCNLSAVAADHVDGAMTDGGVARFAPVVAVLTARADPHSEMRWGQFRDTSVDLPMKLLLPLSHVPIPNQALFVGRVSKSGTHERPGDAGVPRDGATVVIFCEQ